MEIEREIEKLERIVLENLDRTKQKTQKNQEGQMK